MDPQTFKKCVKKAFLQKKEFRNKFKSIKGIFKFFPSWKKY